MTDRTAVLSILKTALKIESDGANFYSMAAISSGNQSAKEIFSFLADEEKEHYEFFLVSLKAFEKGDNFDYSGTLKTIKTQSDKAEDVFDQDFMKRLKGDNFSLSAVSIGIKLEKNSIDFYRKLQSQQKDDEARKFYDFLIKTEVTHHDLLAKMEKEMIEDSWNENRFSPF